MNAQNTGTREDGDFQGDDFQSSDLANDLALSSMSLDELKEEAKKRNITLKSTERAEMIDEIISSSVDVPTDVKPGILISLHSRTDEAKKLIQGARNVMTQNQAGEKTFTLLLRNRAGQFYQQVDIPGCRVRPETLQKVLEIASPLPDGSQDQLLKDLKDHPERFEQPLLVRMKRKNGDTNTYSNYVMLYVKERQRINEQQF